MHQEAYRHGKLHGSVSLSTRPVYQSAMYDKGLSLCASRLTHSLPQGFRVAAVRVDVLNNAQDVREDVLVELLHRTQLGVNDFIDCRIARRHPAFD